MVYLIGEVLAFLAAAAVIGAAMAWSLRTLGAKARERRLQAEMEGLRAEREAAEAQARSLQTQVNALGAELERRTRELMARIGELEARLHAAATGGRKPARGASGGFVGWLRQIARSIAARTTHRQRAPSAE